MSENQPGQMSMRVPKEITLSGLIITIASVIAVPTVLNIGALIYNTGVTNTKVEALDRRSLHIGTKVDQLSEAVSGVKMDVNGIEIKLKNVDEDVARMNRNVDLTRSQAVSAGRTLRKIEQELDPAKPINGRME